MILNIDKDGRLSISNGTTRIMFTTSEVNKLRRYLENNCRRLRPKKNWAQCPYEGHHDSCDCQGMGGDR